MDGVIRDVLIRAKMELLKTELPAPDLAPFFKEAEQNTKLVREQMKLVREAEEKYKASTEAYEKAEQEKQRAIEETTDRLDESAEKLREIDDLTLKSAEGFRTAADGAFTFARGLALSSLEGSESLDQVVRKIAEIQAKFDLLRGGVDILKGGTEAARSLSAAIEAAGGVTELLKGRVRGAAGAFTTLASFLGPQGLIVAGSVAAAGALTLLWKDYADSAREANEQVRREIEETERKARQEANRQSDERLFANLSREQQRGVRVARAQLQAVSIGGTDADRVQAIEQLQDAVATAVADAQEAIERQKLDAIGNFSLSRERLASLRSEQAGIEFAGAQQQSEIALQLGAAQRQADSNRQRQLEQDIRRRDQLRQDQEGIDSDLRFFSDNPRVADQAARDTAELRQLEDRNLESELEEVIRQMTERYDRLLDTVDTLAQEEKRLDRRQVQLEQQLVQAAAQ